MKNRRKKLDPARSTGSFGAVSEQFQSRIIPLIPNQISLLKIADLFGEADGMLQLISINLHKFAYNWPPLKVSLAIANIPSDVLVSPQFN